MFVLAVQLDEPAERSRSARRGRQGAVDERAAPALARDLAADDDLARRRARRSLRCGVRFAGPHQIGRRAGAEQQADRLDEDGLARAGLAGQDVEAGLELDLDGLDHRKVADAEKTEHARGTSIVSYI